MMNSILNYTFLVFLLIAAMFFSSFWFTFKLEFLSALASFASVLTWTITILSVVLAVVTVTILVTDSQLKALDIVWTIARMLICILISVVMDTSSMLITEGITISI